VEPRFRPSPRHGTIGIEEELLLADPATLTLQHSSERVLERMAVAPASAGHDLYAAQIELRSPPCSDVHAAVAAIAGLRAAATAAGATVLGVGVHPDGRRGDAEILSGGRYDEVGRTLRGLVQRTPECALHLHVGATDGDAAVRILNGLREYVPLFTALAASSPYWFGTDSGLASARTALVRAYPRHGVARAFHDFADYLAALDAYRQAFAIADDGLVWWDVRLRPALGTVELRGMDSQSSLDAVAALAALVQALAAAIEDGAPTPVPPTPTELLAESAFLACRDGVAGRILHRGTLTPVPEVVADTLAWLTPYARGHGSADALEGVARLLEDGGAPARHRNTHQTGGMSALLRRIARETAAPPSGSRPKP
jgi:glutamate---cysteine ligase / carboxylate-amine ligase